MMPLSSRATAVTALRGCATSEVGTKPVCKQVAFTQLALPNDEDAPPQSFEGLDVSHVALLVLRKLRPPKRTTRLRQRGLSAAGMLMPKTSVNQNYFMERRKHNIRAARQVAAMKSKSVPQCVRDSSNQLFGLGIFTPNLRHQTTALWSDRGVHCTSPRVCGPADRSHY
jgi:hypothetical protein